MISEHYFHALEKANQNLTNHWNVLVKMRTNSELGDLNRLKHAEMAYFHSLQIVLQVAENAVNAHDLIYQG